MFSQFLSKRVVVSFIFFCLILSCVPASKTTAIQEPLQESKEIVEQRQLLKEYALCDCIRYGYKNTEVYEDVTVSLYNEAMLYSPYTLDTVSMLAKKIAESVPPLQHFDYNKKRPILGGCIEFFKSKMLDSLIRTYDYQLKE